MDVRWRGAGGRDRFPRRGSPAADHAGHVMGTESAIRLRSGHRGRRQRACGWPGTDRAREPVGAGKAATGEEAWDAVTGRQSFYRCRYGAGIGTWHMAPPGGEHHGSSHAGPRSRTIHLDVSFRARPQGGARPQGRPPVHRCGAHVADLPFRLRPGEPVWCSLRAELIEPSGPRPSGRQRGIRCWTPPAAPEVRAAVACGRQTDTSPRPGRCRVEAARPTGPCSACPDARRTVSLVAGHVDRQMAGVPAAHSFEPSRCGGRCSGLETHTR